MNKKLFLIDGMALIFRAYYAMKDSPRLTRQKKNTNAQFGFVNTILELIDKNKPTHIAVVLDTKEPTQRHRLYKDYKANREEPPEDLIQALPDIDAILEALRVAALRLPGYEADDIIGTLSVRAQQADFEVFMVTNDKDYGQLVTDKVKLYKPPYLKQAAQILGEADILQKWGIAHTRQLIDILGLMGDAVDNIPGVKGVGEKTAAKLIAAYGSVEEVLARSETIAGALGEKLRRHQQDALLSKQLATIDTNVPVAIDWEDLKIKDYDAVALEDIFTRLEFKTLLKRVLNIEIVIGKEGAEEVVLQNINTVPHHYEWVETEAEIQALLAYLSGFKTIALDTETTSLEAQQAHLVGMSFCSEQGKAYFMSVPDSIAETRSLLSLFETLFSDTNRLWVGQNLKYDLLVLAKYGVKLRGQLFDTMVAQYLLDTESKKSLDDMALRYLHYQTIPIERLIGVNKKQPVPLRLADKTLLRDYAAEDADITFQLYVHFQELLRQNNLCPLFETCEMPLLKVLVEMEQTGCLLDTAYLAQLSQQLSVQLAACQADIFTLCGQKFNIASPRQLGYVLFEHLGLDPQAKKTKTGQYVTDEEALQKLADKHPVIAAILQYREVAKLKSTYVDALPLLAREGRVQTHFNQVMTATGRLSSFQPNLQNIPVRTELGRKMRQAFIAPEGRQLMSADYSQIELRIMAALSADTQLIKAFQEGADIHLSTAARIYGVAENEVTAQMRYKAKSVNFGIIYGQTAFGLSQMLKISRTEAQGLIDQYFTTFKGVAAFIAEQKEKAAQEGCVYTLMGRRRILRNIHSKNKVVRAFDERNAINMPIQGTAADMIKMAMIRIDEAIRQAHLSAKMLLQVHDELLFEVADAEITPMKDLAKTAMTEALPLPHQVPVTVVVDCGKNWLAAH